MAAALELVARGLCVLQIWPAVPTASGAFICGCDRGRDCDHPGKHPHPRFAPRGCHSASKIETVVRDWWTANPHANIGIGTGDEVIVLDIDVRNDGFESLQELEQRHGTLPATWRAITGGGGEHVYFATPPGAKIHNSVQRIGSGLDIRGLGGFVVAPPSAHVSGRAYGWSVDHHPDEVPLAPMPEWLCAAAGHPLSLSSSMSGMNAFERSTEEVGHGLKRPQDASVWRELVEGVSEGARNNAIATLAGHLLRRDVDAFVVLELMKTLNVARFQPPLTDRELTGTVNSIASRELRRRGGR
jgi:Bifunctional DNA primase/polymerase, N-terminal/Primase C terminal 1 (PriCT-1)